MSDKDNDNGRVFHIRLNAYERKVLAKMREKFGAPPSGAIRSCIRAAGLNLGMEYPDLKQE